MHANRTATIHATTEVEVIQFSKVRTYVYVCIYVCMNVCVSMYEQILPQAFFNYCMYVCGNMCICIGRIHASNTKNECHCSYEAFGCYAA